MFFKNFILSGKKPFISAVIAAGGSSVRMGKDKLFIDICGIPAIAHTLVAFEKCECISEIIVVSSQDNIERISDIKNSFNISKITKIVLGGNSRTQSVLNGVMEASNKASLVAIHDGARILITPQQICDVVKLAEKTGAATLAVAVKDTIKMVVDGVIKSTVERTMLMAAQTPQVFDTSLIKGALYKAMKDNSEITDDCSALELIGGEISVCQGSYQNIKLTTTDDILIAESFIKERIIEEKIKSFKADR